MIDRRDIFLHPSYFCLLVAAGQIIYFRGVLKKSFEFVTKPHDLNFFIK